MLQVVVHGEDALQVAEELAADPALDATVDVRTPEPGEKDLALVLTVVVSVVSTAGGVAALVDSILGWRDRIRRRGEASEPAAQPTVIIVQVGDRRLRLDDVTPPELELLAAESLDEDD